MTSSLFTSDTIRDKKEEVTAVLPCQISVTFVVTKVSNFFVAHADVHAKLHHAFTFWLTGALGLKMYIPKINIPH